MAESLVTYSAILLTSNEMNAQNYLKEPNNTKLKDSFFSTILDICNAKKLGEREKV